MKKIKILLITLIYFITYILLSFLLKLFNYTFLVWIKNLSVILISLGIIAGSIQFTKNIRKERKILKILLYLLILILSGFILIVNFFYFVFITNTEEVSKYEGIKMLKETRQVLKSNYIKYYDYTNPFIRSRQERVYMSYDDNLSEYEYSGTTFYTKDGKEVQDIYGTEFIDLTSLKVFASEGDATYLKVLNLLDEVDKSFKQNIYKVNTSDNYLFIYLTNNENEFVKDDDKKQELKNTIESFKNIELTKDNSTYSIRFWNRYIAICNDKYAHMTNYNTTTNKTNNTLNVINQNTVTTTEENKNYAKDFDITVFNEYFGENISYKKTVELLNKFCNEYYTYLINSESKTGNNPGIYVYLSKNSSADKMLKDSVVSTIKSNIKFFEDSVEATYDISIGKNKKYGDYIFIERNDLKMLRGDFKIISKTNDSKDNYDYIEDFKVILNSQEFIDKINRNYNIDITNNVKIWSMTKNNFLMNVGCESIDKNLYKEYLLYVFNTFKDFIKAKYNMDLEITTTFNEVVQ